MTPHHGRRRRRKWPPSAAYAVICSATMRRIDRIRWHGQANMQFAGDEPLYAPKTLRWCGDDDVNLASPSECLGDLYWLIPSEWHIRLTGASYPIDPTHCRGTYDSIGGARGPFPAAAAMVTSCCWWLAVG